MCEYIVTEDSSMDKYIYDDKNGLWYDCKEITISLVLSYQPKKNSLLVCGDSGTCGI